MFNQKSGGQSMSQENSTKKCIAVHLPTDLFNEISKHKTKTAQSQSGVIIDLIEKGLGISQNNISGDKIFFFVKVRIDENKMVEFCQKLQSGMIDTSQIILTYCIKDDPAIGFSFWQADSQSDFDEVFAQHKPYYKEILEIIPVISPMDSMKLIMEKLNSHN